MCMLARMWIQAAREKNDTHKEHIHDMQLLGYINSHPAQRRSMQGTNLGADLQHPTELAINARPVSPQAPSCRQGIATRKAEQFVHDCATKEW